MVKTFRLDGEIFQKGTISAPRTCRNSNILHRDDLRNTSILVSEKFFNKFFLGKSNVNAIIKHLLEESSSTLIFGGAYREKNTIAREYQPNGLRLKKISCRIEESLIIELESLSQLYRVSRCRMVSMMLELKELGWLKLMRLHGIVRGTTLPTQLSISLTIFPRNLPKPIYISEMVEIIYDS